MQIRETSLGLKAGMVGNKRAAKGAESRSSLLIHLILPLCFGPTGSAAVRYGSHKSSLVAKIIAPTRHEIFSPNMAGEKH